MRVVGFGLGIGALLAGVLVACGAGGSRGNTATPDADASADDARRTPGMDGGNVAEPGVASCEELGKACVDVGVSPRLSIVFDDTARPVVAYATTDGIRIRRWNDAKWEPVGTVIPNRLLDAGFQLHSLGGKLYLVSLEATQNIHVQEYAGMDWKDVAGSPFMVDPEAVGLDRAKLHSSSRDGKIHILVGFGRFYVKSFDGMTFANETDAIGGAASIGSGLIDVASDGSLAMLYSPGGASEQPYTAYLMTNEAGTSNWTRGNTALVIDLKEAVAFSLTTAGAIVAVMVDGRTLLAERGDGETWNTLGTIDDEVDFEGRLGNPTAVEDDMGQPVIVYPVYPTATDILVRAKVWNGTSWRGIDSRSSLASSLTSATVAAASKGKTIGTATSRAEAAFQYIGYDELLLP